MRLVIRYVAILAYEFVEGNLIKFSWWFNSFESVDEIQ